MIAVFLRKHVIGYMVNTSATYVHIAFFVKKKKKKKCWTLQRASALPEM